MGCPVALCGLKRFAYDEGQADEGIQPTTIRFDERVAIVGAGPAGLTAAYELLRQGFRVTVFDALPVATAPLARQGALDLLAKEFPANTWFAVFKVDRRGMRPLQAFTSDRARLASAVDFATTGDDAGRLAPATSG